MKEQQLLELAAKAAGIPGAYSETHPEFGDDWIQAGIWYNDEDDCFSCWNPLQNDGVAFRLAVCMDFGIEVVQGFGRVRVGNGDDEPVEVYCHSEDIPDMYTATRIAITKAAAEIGKVMK